MEIQENQLFHIENSNIEWWFVVIFSLINLNMTHVTHDTLMCRSCWVIFVSWSIQISVTEYIWQALTQQNAWRLLPLMMLQLNLTSSCAICHHILWPFDPRLRSDYISTLAPLVTRVETVISHHTLTNNNRESTRTIKFNDRAYQETVGLCLINIVQKRCLRFTMLSLWH